MAIHVSAPVRIDISGGWSDSDPYRKDFGGAVLNAAINWRVSADFDGYLKVNPGMVPSHSGLGTSGALRAVELAASNTALLKDRTELIKRVHRLENEIVGHRAGFQDEAAAIYGGVNYWEFGANGSIKRTPISKNMAQYLEKRLVLVYLAEDHLSANIHDLVFGPDNYERNIPRFDEMKEISKLMIQNFSDEDRMAHLINLTWDLQRLLHKSVETEKMRQLQKTVAGKYLAARVTGAGGGGSMIFYTLRKDELIEELNKPGVLTGGARVLDFEFDWEGIKLES